MAKYNWLFIVTYGRSGSTLLQGILNSFDGYQINGENNFALIHLFRTVMAIKHAHLQHGKQKTQLTSPWYGIDNVDINKFQKELINSFIDNILNRNKDTRTCGFKEIRYNGLNEQEIPDYIEFVTNSFENPCFIFNERDIDNTAKSKFWNHIENPEKVISDIILKMKKMYALAQDRSYWIKYDEYVKNPEKLEGLFSFLGEPFDLHAIQQVLKIKHSY